MLQVKNAAAPSFGFLTALGATKLARWITGSLHRDDVAAIKLTPGQQAGARARAGTEGWEAANAAGFTAGAVGAAEGAWGAGTGH